MCLTESDGREKHIMKIRSAAKPGSAGAAENSFIAVDELENRMGSCQVEKFDRGELMPDRPCEVRLSAEGDGSAMMQLLGTALTRAMVLAKNSGVNARIYAECAPQDAERMELLTTVGLIDDDALVRMSRCVVGGGSVVRLPEGCVFVMDDLSDARERQFFLERQSCLFGRSNPEVWLEAVGKKRLMKRLLLTSREGLAGELVCWAEKGEGIIGLVYTAPAWRRKGVATYLMEAARQYFYQMRIPESHVDVRLKQTAMMRVAATAGYRQSEVLTRLPGINLDAPRKRARY